MWPSGASGTPALAEPPFTVAGTVVTAFVVSSVIFSETDWPSSALVVTTKVAW